jgi:CNT family concentrative nucleoside transporter
VERLISFVGLLVMILLAWLMSSHKQKFPWRMVVMGVALQFILAWITIKTVPGQLFFGAIGDFFTKLLEFTDKGGEFVFGANFKDHFFAFKVLPTIIFFSCIMTMLYYLGAMQWMVKAMAFVMQKTLGTSGAETLSASANIFLGQTEAPLVIKPYLATMTQSELNAVMISGFAGVSGGVLAAFVSFGIDAGHLVTASVISAPASLLLAKVMIPETEKPATLGVDRIEPPPVGANLLEAAAIGASDGLKLALNVAAMLIAFLALIAMLDWVVVSTGDGVAWLTGWQWADRWSLQNALGTLFAPLAWVMGVEWSDAGKGGELLGLKTFANEFVAYARMGDWVGADKATLIELLKSTGELAAQAEPKAVEEALKKWMQADRAAINELVARADHNWLFNSRDMLTGILRSAGELTEQADLKTINATLKQWQEGDRASLEEVLRRAQDKGYKIEFTRLLQPRTVTILTYALCGFSNFSSIGIQIGGLGAMAPERQSDFARLGLKAMICGALATCMTACVAGILI